MYASVRAGYVSGGAPILFPRDRLVLFGVTVVNDVAMR